MARLPKYAEAERLFQQGADLGKPDDVENLGANEELRDSFDILHKNNHFRSIITPLNKNKLPYTSPGTPRGDP